jgi:eukaryotic translation initiation factor 2C
VVTEVRNIAIPPEGYAGMRGQDSMRLATRPPHLSKAGTPIRVGLNMYDASISNIKVYQYDVFIGNGAEKRGLIKAVWESKIVQQAIGKGFIFDGNKLAWSLTPLGREVKLLIDLDAEKGRAPKAGKDNKHRIFIRQTNQVALNSLVDWMGGRLLSFDNACLEAITFLNHVLRETPSLKYTTIKQ